MIKRFLFITMSLLISMNCFAELRTGYIQRLYVDPNPFDVVVTLFDINGNHVIGQCGTNFYHIQKSNENFKEIYALMLSASLADKEVTLSTTSCLASPNNPSELSRNVVDSGYMLVRP